MSEIIILNDRYQLVELLGSGGMSVVYSAHDLTLERTVAIKILRQDLSRDEEFRMRFRQEAKAAANLSHPNIVTVHDFGYAADQLYIVMEYVPGVDLKTLMRQNQKLNLEQALNLMIQACAGIGYAHQSGIVHCDVKPQNMLVTPDGRLKVVDFGIARALELIKPDERHEVVWGSPQYFSPEQAAGLPPSPASDVYSLGVILFEMLTGELPFNSSDSEELARLHLENLPPSPRRYDPAIPVQVEKLILNVLSKDPSSRPSPANQLGILLNELLDQNFAESNVLIEEPLPETLPTLSIATAWNDLPQAKSVKTTDFDWITWLFALLTLLAVGGLIPFWIWVFISIKGY
jgi:serine/threonine protein kinase